MENFIMGIPIEDAAVGAVVLLLFTIVASLALCWFLFKFIISRFSRACFVLCGIGIIVHYVGAILAVKYIPVYGALLWSKMLDYVLYSVMGFLVLGMVTGIVAAYLREKRNNLEGGL